MKKIYAVTDLGPGDGGKGGVVHKVATMMCAHTIIKVGGAQGSHGVCTSRGERFAFSQWGCGTLEGIKTFISPRFIISVEGLLNEGDALRYQCGVHNPFALLTVDERALCTTAYHGISSRLKEMALGNNPRGTIGTGVGEAYRYAQRHPELAIYARDLRSVNIRDRLVTIRQQIQQDLELIIAGSFLKDDQSGAQQEIEKLYDENFLDYTVNRFQEGSRKIKVVDEDYMASEILAKDGVVVVESSHGVLTDNLYGFHPHTSAIRTLPVFNQAMLREACYDGQIVNLGVTRAYSIRHGAGPMPTDNPEMAENLLPGSSKDENRYQGKVRVGPMDLVLLRYAIDVCGGPSAFDALAITWFDQIKANGVWQVCNRYNGSKNPHNYLPSGAIKVWNEGLGNQCSYQEELGVDLNNCRPVIQNYEIPPTMTKNNVFHLCADVLQKELAIPVRLVSFGATERDKICL